VLAGKRIPVPPLTDLDLSQVPFELTPEERRAGFSGLMQQYLGDAFRAMGDPGTPGWPSGAAKAYDNISLSQFLKEQGASHGAVELLEYPFASAEDDPVSLLWNLRDFWYAGREKSFTLGEVRPFVDVATPLRFLSGTRKNSRQRVGEYFPPSDACIQSDDR
jgi:hypothetical protein